MTSCLLAVALSFSSVQGDSSFHSTDSESNEPLGITSPLHVLTSAYGTLGSYSTSTDTRSLSSYVTLTNSWRDYYTLGFSALWLQRSDAGGKYYSQQVATARALAFVTDQISLSGHYAYLNEGEIANYSGAAVFHWLGGGANYWFSYWSYVGTSISISLSKGNLAASAFRGWYSLDLGGGIWATSMAVVTGAEWAPYLFTFRQVVSVPLGNESYIIGWADIGRRGFYFDDESLVAYNQREIQTGAYAVKGIVKIVKNVYAIPSFELGSFDDYTVKYGSLGIRVIF